MRRYLEALKEVAHTGSARIKGSLLRKADSPILRDILYYAFSPTVTFDVGIVEYESGGTESLWNEVPPVEFLTLCRRLNSDELQGNAAEIAVQKHIESYPHHLRSMVRDIFARKLNLGIDETRINAAIPSAFPTFGIMSAYEYESGKLDYPVYVSGRLDGMRAIVINDDKGIAIFSQRGKPIVGVPHILNAIRKLSYGVYDGVLTHPDGLQTLIGICRQESPLHPKHVQTIFHIADRVELTDWDSPKILASERFDALRSIITNALSMDPTLPLQRTPHFKVSSSLKLQEYHRHFINTGHIATLVQGDLPYVKKRSWNLMTLKEFSTLDCRVIGWEPGYTTGKYRNRMGRLICEDLKTGTRFRLGTGFVAEDREITDGWVGRIIEVKYQGWTELPDGSSPIPQYPTYIRTRTDLE